MTDPALPLDLARYMRSLERRIGELERSNPLNRASAYDGTRTRVEIGAFNHPVSASATFGLHVTDSAGVTSLLVTDDGDESGVSEELTITGANWGRFNTNWEPLTVTRVGRMAYLTGMIATTGTPTDPTTLVTLDAKYRPEFFMRFHGVDDSDGLRRIDVEPDGDVVVRTSTTATSVSIGFAWPVAL